MSTNQRQDPPDDTLILPASRNYDGRLWEMIAKRGIPTLAAACAIAAIGLCASAPSVMANGYIQKNLVSDGAVSAVTTDPNLLNPWGITFFPGGPFWISDNNSGLSTLYDGLGDIIPLVVTIRPATGSTMGSPTGIVVNANPTLFIIPKTTDPALFIFASEDGTIHAWNNLISLTDAQLVIDHSHGGSATGSVYKGLALGNNTTGSFLYATNFRGGRIEVFNSTFAPATLAGNFRDPNLPAGFAPFGIANVLGNLFVTYARQDPPKHDPVIAVGFGFVDIFDTNGNLIKRFATRGNLNAPWGVTLAPFNFGQFSNMVLIGNFGDGLINVYNPLTDKFVGQLASPSNKTIAIDGLWALTFGGALDSDPGTLYFSAGTNDEADGLFGSLSPQ
jgi:uncharacterized protein (TIGR03118 family)